MFGEFDREANNNPQEASWQGWGPPWMSPEEQGPHGPFGPGFGPGRHWGHRGWRGPRGPFGFGFGPGRHWGVPDELLALRTQAFEVARLFAIASRGAFQNKERLSQLRAILDRTQKELSDMIYGSGQGQVTGERGQAGGPTDIGHA